MERSYKVLGLITCVFTIACSNQWREVDGGVSAADVKQYLADAQQVDASSTDGTGASLADDSSTTIFFADAPSAYGPVASVLAFDNLDFLGISGVSYKNVSQARVFFLHSSSGQDTLIVGIVSSMVGANGQLRAKDDSDPFSGAGVDTSGTDTSGTGTSGTNTSGADTTGTNGTNTSGTNTTANTASSFTYYTFTGQGSVNDGEYSVTLTGGQRSITLRSNDLDGNTFRSVIQMRAYLADDQGNQQYLGKFSTLQGF